MDLQGRAAVVFGATGNVGYGAAHALVGAGMRVFAPTRSAASGEALVAALGPSVVPLVGDIGSPTDAVALRDAVVERGGADHVFVALGGWWQRGAVAGQPPAEWASVRAMLLDGHVHAASLFLPMLRGRAGSTYTLVTGAGALRHLPGTSLLFVATNGLLALSRVLREEHGAGDPRVNELLISTRIEREPRPGVVPSEVWGRAVLATLRSGARGEQLRYGGPGQFPLADDGSPRP